MPSPYLQGRVFLMSDSVHRAASSPTSVPNSVAPPVEGETFAVGIDVSRQHLDLDEFPSRNPLRFEYTTEGIQTLRKQLQQRTPFLIVIEGEVVSIHARP